MLKRQCMVKNFAQQKLIHVKAGSSTNFLIYNGKHNTRIPLCEGVAYGTTKMCTLMTA